MLIRVIFLFKELIKNFIFQFWWIGQRHVAQLFHQQVWYHQKGSTVTTTSNSIIELHQGTITPTSPSNKILIDVYDDGASQKRVIIQ